jgi:hypothetical protein
MGDEATVPLPDWVHVVLAAAPQLRAAGVASIGMGEFSASFLPRDPDIPKGEIDKGDAGVDDEPLADMWSGTRGFEPEPR